MARAEELHVDPFRIRVREVEHVGFDNETPASQMGTSGELTERTVFTDVALLELPP